MVSLEYKQNQEDHTLFIRHSVTKKTHYMLRYIDDMIIVMKQQH